MPKRKRRTGATSDLARLTGYFAQELASRPWGHDEFTKLVAASKSAREPVDDHDREMTRFILSALDRVTSLAVASDALLQILVDDADKPIAPKVLLDIMSVLLEQARQAIADAFGAVRATERSPMRYERRIRRVRFAKAAAMLAKFQPEPSDLVALLSGRLTPVQCALRESMMACWFAERAIESVQSLVTAEEKKGRSLDPKAVKDLANFLMNAASFARDVITLRVATAIEATGKRKAR